VRMGVKGGLGQTLDRRCSTRNINFMETEL
jgi:hypothetical protein